MICHPLLSRMLVACLASAAFTVQAQHLPDPDAVSLERLSLMQGFSPPPDKVVNNANRGRYPQMRWALQHTRELVSTRNVRRRGGTVPALPATLLPLERLSFVDDKSRTLMADDWLRDTDTDSIVVLHKGRVVFKRYVPELKGSAWGDMKLRQVLDMTGTVRFREVHTEPTTEIFPYLYASGLLPPPASYNGPSDIYAFLRTSKEGNGEHGDGFAHRTVHSEVLGWIVSRVTGRHFADLLSERIWTKLGMEEVANVMVDRVGTALQGAGLSASARDHARLGAMLRRGASEVNGQMLHVNPAAELVMVKLSSQPLAGAAVTHPLTLRAWDALARAVRGDTKP